MQIPDVNVLVSAARSILPHHDAARRWLADQQQARSVIAVPGVVLSGLIRVGTNSTIFSDPDRDGIFRFARSLLAQPSVHHADPSHRHLDTFLRLCEEAGAQRNSVSDAYLAAVAMDLDATFVTFDRGFARFPGLRWTLLRA